MPSPIEKSQVSRSWGRTRSRPGLARKAHLRRVTLENLEPRTLMAVLPGAVHDPNIPLPQALPSGLGGDSSAPIISVDPINAKNLVAVWTQNDPNPGVTQVFVEGAESSNGGSTWFPITLPPVFIDPASGTNPLPFVQVTDPSVAFDLKGNFYVLEVQHSTSNGSGDLILGTYGFNNGAPSGPTTNLLKTWFQGNQMFPQVGVFDPTIAVDDSVPTFTDPSNPNFHQNDPASGTVYVAYTADTPPPATNPPNPWNRLTVQLQESSDGGATFSAPFTPAGVFNAFTNQHDVVPRITVSQGTPDGRVKPGQVTMVWDDFGSLSQNSPPLDVIWAAAYAPGQGFISGETEVTVSTLIDSQNGSSSSGTAITAMGSGPAPVIASDNTLGAFSPHQGRLYIAYVDRIDNRVYGLGLNNPADNTDIFLSVSDDGGQTWTSPSTDPTFGFKLPVNNDNAATDGFSEAATQANLNTTAAFMAGRPQLEPAIAVDQSTGTLVVSYLDTRYDASRVRTATTIATSIDGGVTFGPQPFANAPLAPFDEITQQNVNLGPIPDNQSGGNPVRDGTFGFGIRQGLAVSDGRIYAAWSSNDNGGFVNTPNTAIEKLHIAVAPMEIAAGPRVISSTMGPVQSTTVDGTMFNDVRAADGTQSLTGFSVTFDRPVDPATFTASQVQVFFNSATAPAGTPPVNVPLAALNPIIPLDDGQFGATTFLVKFATPQAGVGTYSYSVGPGVSDRIRTATSTLNVTAGPTIAYPAPPNQVNLRVPPVGTGGSGNPAFDITHSFITVNGLPPGQGVFKATVNLTINHTFDPDLIITLIAPDGTPVNLANTEGFNGFPNVANYTNTTFDDNAATPIFNAVAPFTGSFRPEQPLSSLFGHAASGTWQLEIQDQFAVDTGTLISWTLTLQTGTVTVTNQVNPGNKMDQNANGVTGELPDGAQNPGDVYQAPGPAPGNGVPFQAPYTSTTLPLIVPGPHVVSSAAVLTSTGNEAPPTADNLVTNDTVGALDVVFDRDMLAGSFTPDQVLRIMGPTGPINGPFTVTADPPGTPAAMAKRTFRIGFPTQELSGTYTLQLGTGLLSASGIPVDANLNAGLDELRGVNPSGATVSLGYKATNPQVPVAIVAQKTIDSTITVPDDFLVQGLTLQLNITIPNDTDLEATLIAPDGTTRIPLFIKVGSAGGAQGFADTVFDDTAQTPIANGGRPFFGSFKPQSPLSVWVGKSSKGTWTLEIKNDSAVDTGTLNSWSLNFQKAVPTNGLGEPVADRTSLSFRIFTMDPTNPLSSNTWTAVGPASIGSVVGSSGPEQGASGRSGRIGGLALDPSDPTGNTVYVGGASGGIWKTTDFLTTNPQGPTYVPLTDFGPTFAINIGSIAVFGRNNDPNQSIVFGTTGEGDTGSQGDGFIRSMDGGATWQLLDSTTNVDSNGNLLPIDSPLRDHMFSAGGMTSFKIVVDPSPTISGQTIVYAALSGPNGGIWRSLDTGNHWQLMRAGQATDVLLDPASGFVNAVSNPTGNLQIVYGAFRADGVYVSSNQGGGWGAMSGGVGFPHFQQIDKNPPIPLAVSNNPSPMGNNGRIVLAKPALVPSTDPNAPLENLLYEGWLYAAVVTPDSHLQGLYITKDFGQNWTQIHLYNRPSGIVAIQAVPTNDPTKTPEYDPLGGGAFSQGNYDISLAVDPVNPNVVYLGGTADGQPTGLIRVDITGLSDIYSFYMGSSNADGGAILASTHDPITLSKPNENPGLFASPPTILDARTSPEVNMIQDPTNVFGNSTFYTFNGSTIANSGINARWIPFDAAVAGSTDQHRVIAVRDPLTGDARLIFGDDQGVFTGVDAGDGTLVQSVGGVSNLSDPSGNVPIATGSRNGNLQITQFYYGAAQPSNLAAQIAVLRGMFYGDAQDDGFPVSDPNIIGTPGQVGYGNLVWIGPGGDGGGVATDQTGTGNVYQYAWPCCGGNTTDFFKFNGIGRTFGLVQRSMQGNVPDPQWPFTGVVNFAVNPIDGAQAIISSFNSSAGPSRVFRTETLNPNQTTFWLPIADPSVDSTLDGAQALALAYGAPDPGAPGGVGSLDNFLYFGTEAGHIYMTRTGGGVGQWTNISNGLLDNAPIQQIITNPTRGSHEAYAVSSDHVYHIIDSTNAAAAGWQDITGNLFQITHDVFGQTSTTANLLAYLSSIQADWRYLIPNNPANPTGPTHPLLYVAGEAGVYRSFDDGQTWSRFPSVALDNTPQEPSGPNQPVNVMPDGGYLPVAHVSALGLSLGNINPTNGRAQVTTSSPNILMATTYGRGAFAIRLAPIVLPGSVMLDPNLPPPGGSDSGLSKTDKITNVVTPVIDGLSEQTAFGNLVTVNLIDETKTDTTFGQVIGTGMTDAQGHFAIQVNAGVFKSDGSTDGFKTIGVQAVDGSGTKGNIATLTFQLITVKPAAPTGLKLDPTLPAPVGSDSGLSQTDRITNITSPYIDVTPSGPNPAAGEIELLRDGVVVNTVLIPAGPVTGPVMINDPGIGILDGTHVYTAIQEDVAGNTSPVSASLTITLDTVPPNIPSVPMLAPADDSGVKGDGITNIRQPHLIGTIVPETVDPIAQIQIISATGTILGTAFSAAGGAYSVQFASPLADGVYSVRARAEDVAGNFSNISAAFVLQITTKLPTAPTIALLPSDDSGTVGDNITNVTQPHLFGTTDPGVFVDLIDTNGDVTGIPGSVLTTVTADSAGNYLIQFPTPLADGVYHIQTQARDVANNTSLSPVLVLTIKTKAPTTAPTLGLSPADDTGIKGDGITTVRRPHLIGVGSPNGVVQVIDSTGATLATATADGSGNYSLQLPQNLNNGTILLRARATDVAGNVGPTSLPFSLTITTTNGDYTNTGSADLAVFRSSNGQVFVKPPAPAFGYLTNTLGQPGDIPLQGDFDGDGKTDVAFYRPSTGTWYIYRSTLGFEQIQFGEANVDIPVVGDYNGAGRTDLAVYRPTNNTWYVLIPGGAPIVKSFGQAGDIPAPGAYDGNLTTEIAVYRPSTAQFVINGPGNVSRTVKVGTPGGNNVPIPNDYDGIGKDEPAVYQPATATWLIDNPITGIRTVPSFGVPNTDIPVPRDYNGDGKADLGVYRPSNGTWYILLSGGGALVQQFGASTDIPIPEPLSYLAASLMTKSQSHSVGGGSGGFHAMAFDFGQQAASLAGGSTPATVPVPVAIPGPSSGTSMAAITAPAPVITPAPAPAAPPVLLSSGISHRRRINVVHRASQQTADLHKHAAANHHDSALAAVLGSLGRIKLGRFLPTPGA